jgi:hypothetical protein
LRAGEETKKDVVAGPDPAIHPFRKMPLRRLMDTRVKPAYDKCASCASSE